MTRDKFGLRDIVGAVAAVIPFFLSHRREMNAEIMGIPFVDYIALFFGVVAVGFALANITWHNSPLYKNVNIIVLLIGIFHVLRGFGLLASLGI